jgi:uncharacterized phiE125 gp8 family phage protein
MTGRDGYVVETAPPGAEPLSLQEAKDYLRVTGDGDDALIAGLITAAREACEDYTGRALITRGYSLFLDAWPEGDLMLPRPPLVAVTQIRVAASDVPPESYVADASGRLVFLSSPPAPGVAARGIEIRFTAGYGARAEDVPAALRTGMKQVVARLYESRGDTESGLALPSSARALFHAYRVMGL